MLFLACLEYAPLPFHLCVAVSFSVPNSVCSPLHASKEWWRGRFPWMSDTTSMWQRGAGTRARPCFLTLGALQGRTRAATMGMYRRELPQVLEKRGVAPSRLLASAKRQRYSSQQLLPCSHCPLFEPHMLRFLQSPKIEWLLGCSVEDMSRLKALEVLGITSAMLEEERARILGSLGVKCWGNPGTSSLVTENSRDNADPCVFRKRRCTESEAPRVTELEDECLSQHLRIQQLELQVRDGVCLSRPIVSFESAMFGGWSYPREVTTPYSP